MLTEEQYLVRDRANDLEEIARNRSLSSRMRHSVVEFSEQPPVWSVC